ncbi:MAG TPA: DNA double-strand break repair nuclease NurA [Candidatus Dormibacteraeota bacterium]|nr:DNA double-strand break repair nuclease NurA [Candidatus Dormibacteraeota bacterium]
MDNSRKTLRLDPWPPEYDSAVQFGDIEGASTGTVNAGVETQDWQAIAPGSTGEYEELCFVDGVRRIEARVIADSNDKMIHGLFGSIGVGAVRVRGASASFTGITVERFLILGEGLLQKEEIEVGEHALVFEGLASAQNSPIELLGELQNVMRTREAHLGKGLSSRNVCVFADGPLTYFASSRDEVVGIIKTIHLPYLTAKHFSVVGRLLPGQRTPLFGIEDGKYDRYSWFLRLASGRKLDHALAGVIRLEVRAALGLENARRIANASAHELPRFVSSAARDPRAPQNLAPVGNLETELRHRLGDALLLRRGIEKRLLEGVQA